jgi:hypothetical protein
MNWVLVLVLALVKVLERKWELMKVLEWVAMWVRVSVQE